MTHLAAGATIDAHTDPGLEVERSVIRLTVPISTDDAVSFHPADEPVPWRRGECWHLRSAETHRARGDGDTERVHLSIDMEPNDRVCELIGRGTPG